MIRLEYHRKMKCWSIKKPEDPYPNWRLWRCYIFLSGLTESHCCLSPCSPSTPELSWDAKLNLCFINTCKFDPRYTFQSANSHFSNSVPGLKINNTLSFHIVFGVFQNVFVSSSKRGNKLKEGKSKGHWPWFREEKAESHNCITVLFFLESSLLPKYIVWGHTSVIGKGVLMPFSVSLPKWSMYYRQIGFHQEDNPILAFIYLAQRQQQRQRCGLNSIHQPARHSWLETTKIWARSLVLLPWQAKNDHVVPQRVIIHSLAS